MAEAYKDAGIELIGISTDNIADLKLALAPAKAATKATNSFPFSLVADPDKSIFKTYRAFDDFEQIPYTAPSSSMLKATCAGRTLASNHLWTPRFY